MRHAGGTDWSLCPKAQGGAATAAGHRADRRAQHRQNGGWQRDGLAAFARSQRRAAAAGGSGGIIDRLLLLQLVACCTLPEVEDKLLAPAAAL